MSLTKKEIPYIKEREREREREGGGEIDRMRERHIYI